MKKVPISTIIDDPSPVVSVYYHHHNPKTTDDGRPLLETFPNSFPDTVIANKESFPFPKVFNP